MDDSNHNTGSSRTSSRRRSSTQRPKKTNVGLWIIVGLLALLFAGIGGYVAIVHLTTTPSYRISQAQKTLEQADELIETIRIAVETETNDETSQYVDVARKNIEPTRALLSEAASTLRKAEERAHGDEQEAIELLLETIALRGTLLELAPGLLDYTELSAQALDSARKGAGNFSEARDSTVAALEAFDRQDRNGMLDSVKYNNDALTKLARARVEFNDAIRTLEGLNLDVYIELIDLHEQMAQSLINAANSWTSKNETVMKVDLERYDTLKSKVDALFASGVAEPEDVVTTVYFALINEPIQEFSNILQEIKDVNAKVR